MSTQLKNSKLMTKPGFVDYLKALELAKNLSRDGKVNKKAQKLINKEFNK
jgi:hypothetical protein